ncbi:glycosyltransferase [Akkermansia muciniphila]|nr:glycosyltransferase [Akkermansia muciniphila]
MIPDVSIIVPCYNVAAYVDSCLDSLVRQTLRNIEIICINDGSTDETWIHLLRWKEKDSRIILLNQRNAGVSAARNAGLDAARGLYVGFADPDDYMDPEMYSRLFRRLWNMTQTLWNAETMFLKTRQTGLSKPKEDHPPGILKRTPLRPASSGIPSGENGYLRVEQTVPEKHAGRPPPPLQRTSEIRCRG